MAFLDDVSAQPKALHDFVAFYRQNGEEVMRRLGEAGAAGPRSVLFTGMGTSLCVPLLIQDELAAKLKVPVMVSDAGELLHFGLRGISSGDLVIAISQSGESIETRMVVENLHAHPSLIAATNNDESTIAQKARLHIPIVAGTEDSISTKTYTNSLAAMLLICAGLSREDYQSVLDFLEAAAHGMEAAYQQCQQGAIRAAHLLREAASVHVISRGPALAAAAQMALTLQEGAHMAATCLTGAAFRHGPIQMAGPGHYAIVMAPDGPPGDLLRSLATELCELGSKVVLFTSVDLPERANLVSVLVEPGNARSFVFSLAPLQEALVACLADDRFLTAGVFHHGSKTTLRE